MSPAALRAGDEHRMRASSVKSLTFALVSMIAADRAHLLRREIGPDWRTSAGFVMSRRRQRRPREDLGITPTR